MDKNLQLGDVVYAKTDLYNEEGGIPDLPPDALIAEAGTRGVVVKMGHLEDDHTQTLYVVRFEQQDLNLGPPTGCWPDELLTETEMR